jgi:hypothetical protein
MGLLGSGFADLLAPDAAGGLCVVGRQKSAGFDLKIVIADRQADLLAEWDTGLRKLVA